MKTKEFFRLLKTIKKKSELELLEQMITTKRQRKKFNQVKVAILARLELK